jgi:Ca-activated chloride channel family protein
MMLGFQEVDKNFDIRRNNRLILLTDGIANAGVTDPAQIAADALAYNQRGIYLSTIGLGLELNDALLSQLADQGQGGYSFIDSAQEMDRIFRAHVAGLKQRVASNVSLTVIPAAGVRLVSLTGLEHTPTAESTNLTLWPMGTGDSTIVLAQLQVGRFTESAGSRPLAKIQLHYFDEFGQRPVTVEQTIAADMIADLKEYDPTWDMQVLRNITVQQTAEGMREIDRLFQARQYEAAWRLAVSLEGQLSEVAQLTNDSQMQQDVELMRRYQETLADAVWQTENRAPQTSSSETEQQVYQDDTEKLSSITPDEAALMAAPTLIPLSLPVIISLVVIGLLFGLIGIYFSARWS